MLHVHLLLTHGPELGTEAKRTVNACGQSTLKISQLEMTLQTCLGQKCLTHTTRVTGTYRHI